QGLRGFLLENMIEEEGMVLVDGNWSLDPEARHVNWALPFLKACAMPVPEYGDVFPVPAFVERELAQGRWHTAIAYVLVGMERNTPFYFSYIAEALKKHYGMQDHELKFFYNHIIADTEHGNRAVELLAKAVLDQAEREAVLAAVKRGVRAFSKTFSYTLNKTNMTVAC
ncbi:MAG: iron-containing redox enzyme family protein, partial [Arenimonas sp.]